MTDALFRQPQYRSEKRDSSDNSVQLIFLVLRSEHLVSGLMLEGIGIWTVISGLNLTMVPQNNFNAALIEYGVTAAMDDHEGQNIYNAAKDSNPSANIEYLHDTLYFNKRVWNLAKDDFAK
jgi:hypothetical protein